MTAQGSFGIVEGLLRKHSAEVSLAGPKDEALISRAEQFRGVTFPRTENS